MHKIKSSARRHAWDGDSHDGFVRYMPFADRVHHRRSPSKGMVPRNTSDLEAGRSGNGYESNDLNHVHSAGCEDTFRRDVQLDTQQAHAPPRSSTEPSNVSPTSGSGKGKHSTGASDDTIVGSSSSSDETGNTVTKRLPFFNRHKTEDGQVDRQQSGLSRATSRQSSSHKKLTIMHQVKSVLWSWPNILLVCVPAGIALGNIHSVGYLPIFLVNFIAIVPLAGILSYSTEEVALHTGEAIGGLLNASFGNATELIVAIISLVKGQITIVQTSLVGSMLSNLLLVLGMCFALGGYNRPEQHFNMTVAQTACSLLILAGASLIIPTAFQQMSLADNNLTQANEPALSRGTAVILLFVYGCYLFFQLRTHVSIYNAPSDKVEKQNLVRRNTATPNSDPVKKDPNNNSVGQGIAMVGAPSAISSGAPLNANNIKEKDHASQSDREQDEEEEKEEPNLSLIGGIITLCASTALIGVCSEYVVDNISPLAEHSGVPLEFIGLILLPIVGNAAEHATAVTVAIKDKMDLSIGVAVGSSLQIALLVIPLSVVIGWIIGAKPLAGGTGSEGVMTLNFDGFIIAILFVSILLVNYLIQDGKSHWLEGVMLMTTYIIIALAAWFYPNPPGLSSGE